MDNVLKLKALTKGLSENKGEGGKQAAVTPEMDYQVLVRAMQPLTQSRPKYLNYPTKEAQSRQQLLIWHPQRPRTQVTSLANLGHFLQLWPFVTGFVYSCSCRSTWPGSVRIANTLGCEDHVFPVHSSGQAHKGCLHFRTCVNNTQVQAFAWLPHTSAIHKEQDYRKIEKCKVQQKSLIVPHDA